jgi:hypothetical protein
MIVKSKTIKLRATLRFLSRRKLESLNQMHDFFVGEECYLFGDGPSIKFFDLNLFVDKVSIVSNKMPFHRDFTQLNTAFWVIAEPWMFWPLFFRHEHLSLKGLRDYRQMFRRRVYQARDLNTVLSVSNFPMMHGSGSHYFLDYFDCACKDVMKIRNDNFLGTCNALISLAIHLGFKKVYLIGFDYTHNQSLSLHWYESGIGKVIQIHDFNRDFFEQAQKRVEIITVTIDGGSDLLPHLTYQQLTGEPPKFRENTEIADSDFLTVVSEHKDYSI